MSGTPDLNAMVLFARVLQHGSFSEAARRTGTPVSTLSRKVSWARAASPMREAKAARTGCSAASTARGPATGRWQRSPSSPTEPTPEAISGCAPTRFSCGPNGARLVLAESAAFSLSAGEAGALAQSLSNHLHGEGLEFQALRPDRWYLRLPAAPAITTRALPDAAGRRTAAFKATLRHVAGPCRMLNEVL